MLNSEHKHATNWGQLRAFPAVVMEPSSAVSFDDRQLGVGGGGGGAGGGGH